MLHSGHVAFFKEAAQYGDLYVGIGSDATIFQLKARKTICSEAERLYMVKSIRYVKDAYINSGSGMMDFIETVEMVKPDIFVVNEDGGSETKQQFCAERGIEYVVLQRDLAAFAAAFKASFEAQTTMFPAMLSNGVQEWIDRYKDQALAWKLSGAGGGGYLALVCEVPPVEAIRIKIRRRDF